MDFSQAVKALRKAPGRDWSQEDLARFLGTSVSIISKWEQGKFEPRPPACALLANLAGDGSPLREFFLARAGDYAQQTGPGDDLLAQVAQLAGALNRMERRLAALERAASAPADDTIEGVQVRVPRRA